MKLTIDEKEELSEMIDDSLLKRSQHNKMSPETRSAFKLMDEKFCNLEEKLSSLIKKVDNLPFELSQIANEKYATKIEVERVKSRVNFYAWIVPILTGILGFLASKL